MSEVYQTSTFLRTSPLQPLNFEDKRKEVEITDDMARLSVSIEDAKDLIKDLKQALE